MPVKYRLVKNSQYGFMQVKPTPSKKEIARFYAKEFYTSNYPRLNESTLANQLRDKEWYDSGRRAICQEIFEISRCPLRGLRGMTLLDIGCGWGQSLLYFRDKGMDCYGFDPVPEAVTYAQSKGLNVVKATMETMDVFRGRFDVVTLLNVLEHLPDPVATLKEIRKKVLKKGGILIIDVPNEFNTFQLCGQKVHELPPWWIIPPGHLNYFSPSSLKSLLIGTGYKVQSMEASFPMEMFLLFGHPYVKDQALGRQCHEQRMNFELNMRNHGYHKELRALYRSLAEQNLGRQVIAYATA